MSEPIKDNISYIGKIMTRIFDMVVSGICIILFLPLFAYCYFKIKKEDGGPAFFSQERIGLHGQAFKIYKFRTMTLDAESNGPQLTNIKTNDKRLLKVGRSLRDHHLDELPQLWNVFVGDMAFVGPRPERLFYIKKIMEHDSRYKYLYQVRPGVTSYATLYNGYTDTMDKMLRRLELDLYYVNHRSFLLNLRILFLTFFKIISGRIF